MQPKCRVVITLSLRALSSVLLISVVTTAVPVHADAGEQPGPAVVKRRGSGPYCGVYCLYAATRLLDKQVDFVNLLRPEYIGSRKGSSLEELKRAAQDCGMKALAVEKVTSRELRRLTNPVILHVKSDPDKKRYDHFELFLGTKGRKACLWDPPQPIRVEPFHRLAPRWDGTGLIVSVSPIDATALFRSARRRSVICILIIAAVVSAVHWLRHRLRLSTAPQRRRLLGWSVVQCSGLVLFAFSLALTHHFINDEGFLAHDGATASIERAHRANFICRINARKVAGLLNGDTVFIDVRRSRDFQTGHLPGAINIPVNASDEQRKKAVADVAKNAHIVVYCESALCPFGDKVTLDLQSDGFTNVVLFKGGWREWAAKNGK